MIFRYDFIDTINNETILNLKGFIESHMDSNVLTYNLTPLLRNFEKRISTITSILCEKGLLSNEEANQLSSYLYPCNENMDMEHQVENVQQYLSDTKSTIQETKAFLIQRERILPSSSL